MTTTGPTFAGHPRPPATLFLAVDFTGPYFFLACFSQETRLLFCLSFLQALSAFASFCARVSGFGVGLAASLLPRTCTWPRTLPGPENVAVAAAGDEDAEE